MGKTYLVLLIVAFIPFVAAADDGANLSPTEAPNSCGILGEGGSNLPSESLFPPQPNPANHCTSHAQCGDGSSLTCTSTTGSCSPGVDASCPKQRGYVICNGITQWCPPCPEPPSLDCSRFSDQFCTYTWVIANSCCEATWAAPGASCPDICL